MVTVHLILLLAQVYKLDSKAIDFVLAFPQAELDVDIWMYVPIGFQVDTENESKCYILKLNKSLHGLKQARCTGFIITSANCPIYWASCLQTEIAPSTAKAEYIAMSSVLHKVIPLMTLMKELHTIFPVHINIPNLFCKVHEDNQSTIKMAMFNKFTHRTKHIALKYHHFCSHVKNGHIEINYCPTEDQ
jgi:hypothetical protein